jgi:hypothetical protein
MTTFCCGELVLRRGPDHGAPRARWVRDCPGDISPSGQSYRSGAAVLRSTALPHQSHPYYDTGEFVGGERALSVPFQLGRSLRLRDYGSICVGSCRDYRERRSRDEGQDDQCAELIRSHSCHATICSPISETGQRAAGLPRPTKLFVRIRWTSMKTDDVTLWKCRRTGDVTTHSIGGSARCGVKGQRSDAY